MSLYLGKDVNGNALLHLTSGTDGKGAMQSSGPIASTTFHSSLPYMQTVLVESIPFYLTCWWNGQWNEHYYTAKLPDKAISYITAGNRYTILVKTKYSNNNWVSLNSVGDFSRWTDYGSVNNRDYTHLNLRCGNTQNPLDWSRKNNTLSPQNNYVWLLHVPPYGYSNPYYVLRFAAYYDERQDVLYDCKIVVYSDGQNTTTNVIQPNSILLNTQQFIIDTPNGEIDMATFYPVKAEDIQSELSFSSINLGDTYIKPYVPDASSVVGWELQASESSSPYLYKVLNSGKKIEVSTRTTTKLYYDRDVEYSFSLYAENSVSSSGTIITLAADELCLAYVDTEFYSSFAGTRHMKGFANFIDTNTYHVLAFGDLAKIKNGVYYYGMCRLEVYNDNGHIKIRHAATKRNGASLGGTYTGTVRLTVLKIK